MSGDAPDGFTWIGLHGVASADGEDRGLHVCLPIAPRNGLQSVNVIEFPREIVRAPGEVPAAAFGWNAATGRNVIAFAPRPGKSSGRSRNG